MVSKLIKVKNVTGIHLRAANAVCNTAVKYSSFIKIKKNEQVVNAKSILGILSACIRCDDEIIIECEGVDEEAALSEVIRTIDSLEIQQSVSLLFLCR